MKESQFNALVRLLDDEDPEVSRQVEAELLALGGEGIPRLEAAWEVEKNRVIQTRLEDIIHGIQSRDTIEELKAWFRDEEPDLLEGWFLVSRFQYPNLEFITFKNKVNRLVNRTWLEFRREMNVGEKLMVLNRMLFGKEEFSANRRSLHHPNNYFIQTFFDTRKGSPLSLGLLYLIICRHLDIPVEGIVLPGYFVVHYQDSYTEFFIDVFNEGAIVTRKDVAAFLKKIELEEDPKYFQGSPDRVILLEFVKGILFTFHQRQEEDKARNFERLLRKLGEGGEN